jgi:uncharacterized protein (TIGR02722 family)
MNATTKYFRSSASILAAALFSASLAGCAADTHARRVETGGPEAITTVDQIDDQDWSEAATKLTKSMLNKEGLFASKEDGSKYILQVDRITNNTSQVVDTDLLTHQITMTLNNAGKVVARTKNRTAQNNTKTSDFLADKTESQPDFILYGKLIQTHANAGDIRQNTFYFQMNLTDKDGNDTWQGQQPITKIGSHNAVGF